MRRTLADIIDNIDFVGCDNETAFEMCGEIDRLMDALRKIASCYVEKFDGGVIGLRGGERLDRPYQIAIAALANGKE